MSTRDDAPGVPQLSSKGHNRLDALLEETENRADEYAFRRGAFREYVPGRLKANHGISNQGHQYRLDMHFSWLTDADRATFLAEVWQCLRSVDTIGARRPEAMLKRNLIVGPRAFERRLNEVLEEEGIPLVLRDGQWTTSAQHAGDEELRKLLADTGDDIASCKQGDIQQEIVASSVQAVLSRPNALLVDYGAGLGRVGEALSTASRFPSAKYLAVDAPISDRLRAQIAKLGTNCEALEREAFLASDRQADVIMVVNTLHHIRFVDLAQDFARLLARLRPAGQLIVHEMGMLPAPEKRNVPWLLGDIELLFRARGLHVNGRRTESKRGTPLSHVIITSDREPPGLRDNLEKNVRKVWKQMKTRATTQIGELLDGGRVSESAALHRALIDNANLDLNQPSRDRQRK